MTNVPRNVLKPPPQNQGGSNKSLMLVTPDPFPSPAHKKKVKGLSCQTSNFIPNPCIHIPVFNGISVFSHHVFNGISVFSHHVCLMGSPYYWNHLLVRHSADRLTDVELYSTASGTNQNHTCFLSIRNLLIL